VVCDTQSNTQEKKQEGFLHTVSALRQYNGGSGVLGEGPPRLAASTCVRPTFQKQRIGYKQGSPQKQN
jgi:hypothetical protein